MSDPVLDTIDHVLHDWDLSADAMRWTPEPVRAPEPTVMDVTASMIRAGEVMRDAQEKLARAFTNMARPKRRSAVPPCTPSTTAAGGTDRD